MSTHFSLNTHPVFDCLQCAKMEGECLGVCIYHVNDINVWLMEWGGVLDQKISFHARVLLSEQQLTIFLPC